MKKAVVEMVSAAVCISYGHCGVATRIYSFIVWRAEVRRVSLEAPFPASIGTPSSVFQASHGQSTHVASLCPSAAGKESVFQDAHVTLGPLDTPGHSLRLEMINLIPSAKCLCPCWPGGEDAGAQGQRSSRHSWLALEWKLFSSGF